jgi:RimJ/RimL family protein N-acetyltransferase
MLTGKCGYGIARAHWGRGFATEAMRGVLSTAFEAKPNLNRIRARSDLRNVASIRVMEKLGMTREGVLRQNRLLRGTLVDDVVYGLLRSEWQSTSTNAAR